MIEKMIEIITEDLANWDKLELKNELTYDEDIHFDEAEFDKLFDKLINIMQDSLQQYLSS